MSTGIRKRLGLSDNNMQMICKIAAAQNEMYLRVAHGFADDSDNTMCAWVIETAAQALAEKAILAKQFAEREKN